MHLKTQALLAASAIVLTTPAMAATQVVAADGKLTGATGVIVGTKTYNVTFVEGTCASVYGSCNQSSFDFKTLDDAKSAAQSLVDQVFVDTNEGKFDYTPSLTFGCSNYRSCRAYVAYSTFTTRGQSYSSVAYASNSEEANFVVDKAYSDVLLTAANTADGTDGVYARFALANPAPVDEIPLPNSGPVVQPPVSEAIAAVPEPATWAMMLVGFGMVGAAARHRRRSTKITFA